jgi:hypothetical protein
MAGRGRAAAQVTSRDAASQLVAVAASRNVKDSVETVRQYGGLISTAKRWDCPFFNPPEMAALGSKHTIIEAIASLIDAGVSGALEKWVDDLFGKPVDFADHIFGTGPRIEITFEGTFPKGTIKLVAKAESTQVYSIVSGGKRVVEWPKLPQRYDLRTTTSFGHFTIMDVARLLRSGTLNTNKSPATQALLDLSK